MQHAFHKLPIRSLATDTAIFRYHQGLPASVTMHDDALAVMTDLKHVKVFTIAPDILIDQALQKMIHAEVRLLIVADPFDAVLGVISAYDIMGERPVSISSLERIPHAAIRVEQVMTSREQIGALRMHDVLNAQVGDIIATLRETGRQHAIVMDTDADKNREILRGIFSITQIGRQLGMAIEPDGKMQSFAELERALHAS